MRNNVDERERRRKSSALYSDSNVGGSSDKSVSNLRKTIGPGMLVDEDEKNGNLIIAIHSSLIVYLSRPRIK